MTNVRVMSFNIRNGVALDLRRCWWLRRSLLVDSIRRLNPDVLGLQEVYEFQARYLRKKLPAYDWYGRGRNDGERRGEQTLVGYRRQHFKLNSAETRWFGPTPLKPGSGWPAAKFPRTATIVELEDRQDQQLTTLINVHLDAHSRAHRLSSAQQLADWLTEMEPPFIMTGDFNDNYDGPAVTHLIEHGRLRHAVPADSGGSSHKFSGRSDGRRIDHILVSEQLRVVGGRIDHRRVAGRLASDHWPLIADTEARPR